MVDPRELKMDEAERLWWERVRGRGAMWYVVSKGLVFLVALPTIGCLGLGWDWDPKLLVEGWIAGLVCAGFVWMRKELRYRFTLDDEGLPLPEGRD